MARPRCRSATKYDTHKERYTGVPLQHSIICRIKLFQMGTVNSITEQNTSTGIKRK